MTGSLRTSLISGVFLFTSSTSHADTPDSLMNRYDVSHYDLSISLNLQKKIFSGKVVVGARVLQPLRELILDASHETLTIDSAKFDDRLVPFQQDAEVLKVILPRSIGPDDSISVAIYYHGTSKFNGEYEGGGVYFSTPDHAATISEPNFARRWWPCKDIPSDKATLAINITVRDDLTAVSNGVLKNAVRHDSLKTFSWQTDYPIATYLVSLAVAPYKEFSDSYVALTGERMKVMYFVYPEDFDKAKREFVNTPKILSVFANEFCEYPFLKEKLAYAEVDGELTMENQTACSIQQSLITGDSTNETTIVHETAHQWWGNLITPMSWKHTWLSEGFATYAEALYRERIYGAASYGKYISWLMSADQGKYAGSIIGRNDTSFWDSFNPRVYSKGAIVLHMLRGVVGDSSFFTIMRNYLNNSRLRYRNASTEDFMKECERVNGTSLQWFFDEWVFASTDSIDRPAYEYVWTKEKHGETYNVRLDLTQVTAGRQLFRMPMPVSISTQHSARTFMITDSLAVQSFTFSMGEFPISLEIDKDNHVFKILRNKGGK